MGGTVKVDSIVGVGTTFTIEISTKAKIRDNTNSPAERKIKS
jgi:signal transduction histidine kinase